MSASMSHASSAEPNLTPILDMVFQLITFFMLVINFKAAAMDLDLKLPVVGSARPVDTQGQEDLLDPEHQLAGPAEGVWPGDQRRRWLHRAAKPRPACSWPAGPTRTSSRRRAAQHRRDPGRQEHAVHDAQQHHHGVPDARLSQLRPEGDEQGMKAVALRITRMPCDHDAKKEKDASKEMWS